MNDTSEPNPRQTTTGEPEISPPASIPGHDSATSMPLSTTHDRVAQTELLNGDDLLDSRSPANEFQPVADENVVFEQRTSYVLAAVVGLIILGTTSPALLFAFREPLVAVAVLLGWLLVGGLMIFGAHFWPKIKHRHTRWRIGEEGMEICRGVWWKHRIAIPVARVQHVDVSQGPVQRMFQLGKLTIHTAGTKNASIELDGLKHTTAMQVRDQLIEQKELLDVT